MPPQQSVSASRNGSFLGQSRFAPFSRIRSAIPVTIAWGRLWCFRLVKLLIAIGYITVIRDGLERVVPALGIRLYKLPLLGALKDYEGLYQLNLALFAGLLLFAMSSSIWCALLEVWLYDNSAMGTSGRCARNYERCLATVGGVILLADACLFYAAMTLVGWGGQTFSLTALISTLAYVAVLVAVCVASVNLKRNYLALKRGRGPQGVDL